MKSNKYKQIADAHFEKVKVPENLEKDLEKLIDSLEITSANEQSADRQTKTRPVFHPLYRAIAVAASVMLIAAVSILMINKQPKQELYAFEDTCASPEEARAELEKTLKLIGSTVSRVNGIVSENTGNIINPKRIIEKTLKYNENNY